MNNNDSYGNFVKNYELYTNAEKGMEQQIGRRPALRQFGDLTGCTVLDFGCGPATNAGDLRLLGASQVVGIDISQEELKVARQIDPLGIYLHYDGIRLANALDGYDIEAILASFSFCAISNAVLQVILQDMRRILPEGGKLVIVDPNFKSSLGINYPGELYYHPKAGVQSDDHLHVTLGEGENAVELYHDIYRTHVDYRRLLSEEGFTIEHFEEVRPDNSCNEEWAELAQKYPPFIVVTAH